MTARRPSPPIAPALIFLLLLLLAPVPLLAQDCGAGLPCGPLPWALPGLPNLQSPTPFQTAIVTETPGPTPSGTITATPTPTSDFSLGEIIDQLATLQHLGETTQQVPGTAEANWFSDETIGDVIPIFFRFTHWMKDFRFGVFTPLAQVAVFIFSSTIVFGLLVMFLPILVPLIGFVRWLFDLFSKLAGLIGQMVQIVVQFIRG